MAGLWSNYQPFYFCLTILNPLAAEWYQPFCFCIAILNPLVAEFIDLVTSAECAGPINWPTAVRGIDFTKLKWWNYNISCIWWFLKMCGCFFVESLPNPATMPELSNWSTSKAWQVLSTKKNNILTKRSSVATTISSGINIIIWSLVYLRIYEARAIPLPSWGSAPRWLQATYTVSNGRLHLQL